VGVAAVLQSVRRLMRIHDHAADRIAHAVLRCLSMALVFIAVSLLLMDIAIAWRCMGRMRAAAALAARLLINDARGAYHGISLRELRNPYAHRSLPSSLATAMLLGALPLRAACSTMIVCRNLDCSCLRGVDRACANARTEAHTRELSDLAPVQVCFLIPSALHLLPCRRD
jgi:hypothetical protein